MSLTETLARRIAATEQSSPGPGEEIAIRGFVDCVGVMLAGWREPVAVLARRHVGLAASAAPFALEAEAPRAALAYGAAAHALDFDDVALAAHPSAVLVPAILAEAVETGASGRQMLAAYLTGYEVWAELWRRDPDPLHDKGWHPTAVLGAMAAAAAAATLRRAPAATVRAALGVAASLASGLVANFGSMTKPFQVGRAAANGLEAVRLAELGLTAAPDAIEHEYGFLRAFSPKGRADRRSQLSADFGRHILRNGLNIKLYPVCYALHRAIDGMIALRAAGGWEFGSIADVEVEIGATQAAMLRHTRPQTAADAKFSLQFAMAAAALRGRVGRPELDDAFVREPAVQGFFGKVRASPIAETDPDEPVHSPFDRVVVTLDDGRRLDSGGITHAEGHFRRPASFERLRMKFLDGAELVLDRPAAAGLFDALCALPSLPNVSALAALCRRPE